MNNQLKNARIALETYIQENPGNDLDTCMIDLLTDLQHYCKAFGVDFDDCLGTAQMHFESEK